MRPNPENPACPHCKYWPTRKKGRTKAGSLKYYCPSCSKYHTPDARLPGKKKRTDGLTNYQAWYMVPKNKEKKKEAERIRRAKKKESDSIDCSHG